VATAAWALIAAAGAAKAVADETAPAPSAPANLTPPTIVGAPEPGKALTATPGTWTESPTSYSYAWERCAEHVAGYGPGSAAYSCSPIPGATAASYTVTESDLYGRLMVTVTAFRGSVAGAPAYASTGVVELHLVPEATVRAALLPRRLPRANQGPAALRFDFTSRAANPPGVPQLGAISFDLSRHLSLDTSGIRSCPLRALYRTARNVCRGSVLGHGAVDSELRLEGEEAQVEGTMTAFYGRDEGQPRILGRVRVSHGPEEVIYVLPFRIDEMRGRFGTKLAIPEMPHITGIITRGARVYSFPYGYGRISRFTLSLNRHGFVTASCPAPKRSGGLNFQLMRATLDYAESSAPYQRRSDPTSVKRVAVVANCRTTG
jgi:hypothetical protein